MRKLLSCSLLLLVIFGTSVSGATFITIGTGGVTGTYYPTGGAICRLLNKTKKQTDIRCSVESTGGSVYNILAINRGEFDFGISQSDTAYQAYHAQGKFKNNPQKELRSIMAIYPELLALVVRKDSNIQKLTDIKDKRINIDIPGSGTRTTVDAILKAFNIKLSDLEVAGEIKSIKGPSMLKDDKIDGYFGMFGHPTANIKDVANAIDIDLVPIKGSPVDKLIKKYPYYAKGIISGTLYKNVTHDTPSIGVKAVLVTSKDTDSQIVYNLVKVILENFQTFKSLHPAYQTITKKSLLDGISIPLHKGALKYYKEAGLK